MRPVKDKSITKKFSVVLLPFTGRFFIILLFEFAFLFKYLHKIDWLCMFITFKC